MHERGGGDQLVAQLLRAIAFEEGEQPVGRLAGRAAPEVMRNSMIRSSASVMDAPPGIERKRVVGLDL
jgi:hypothetical protein